jgi:hypothetical protein
MRETIVNRPSARCFDAASPDRPVILPFSIVNPRRVD